MMKSDAFKHRFFDEIEHLVKRGTNQFILHGNSLYDDLFFSETQGAAKISDSLAFNLYNKQNITKVFALHRDGLYIYEKTEYSVKKRILETKDAILRELVGRENRSSSVLSDARQSSQNEENISQKNSTEVLHNINDTTLINILKDITEALSNKKEPIGIIINSLQWIAELFEGKDHKTNYLEEIEKWKTIDMSNCLHLTFIVLNSIDIIKKYYFIEENSNGVVYVGNPTVDEIYQSYSYLAIDKNVSEKTIKKTASLVKNNGFLLKDAINLFATIKLQVGDEVFYSDENFYQLFVSQLEANIDEDIEWKDVILDDTIKSNILNKFENFLNSQNEVKKGAKGFLFYGPPGTGKTYIAKALANRGGFYFMAPKLADIKGQFVGDSAKNVQHIFNEARANTPTLIFLDELDSLFPQRGGGFQDSFQADITNQFLAEIDGVDSGKQDIFLIGATNRIDIIDSAIISRLERIKIALPNMSNRAEIFEYNLKDISNDLNQDNYILLAKKSDGLSGRDIKNISEYIIKEYKSGSSFEEASRFALQKFKVEVADGMKSSYFDIQSFTEDKKSSGFNKIIGYENEKLRLSGVVDTILHSDKYKDFDPSLANYNGILMYGSPGNGKTHIAHCLANEFELDFVKVIGSSLASSMQDGAVKLLYEITQNVVKLSALHPIMLFFDEFDAIVNPRMDSKLRGTLLDKITDMRDKGNILIVAATNSPLKELDEAIIRDGRFDEKIEFNNPTHQSVIIELFQVFSSGERFTTSNLDFDMLASSVSIGQTSISSVEKLCKDAKRRAISPIDDLSSVILEMKDFGL